MSKTSRVWLWALLILVGVTLLLTPGVQASAQDVSGSYLTYVIPIEGDIDNGNWIFIERAYQEALAANAGAIIFEVDTYGGYVDTAIKIKDLILHAPVPTYTFVNTKAISAGSLIALAGEELIMASGATMGAAEPRLFGERADNKTMSMWTGQLSGTAEARGRDGQIAASFADSDIVIEGLTEVGQLVTLTPLQAVELGMADNVFDTREELMRHYGLEGRLVVQERSTQERLAGWLSNSTVSTILLIVGIAGVVIELLTAGSFGVFGVAGVLGFVLYFMGNFMVGNIGMGAILLFAAGLLLIVLEIFVVPGFGIVGIAGILATLTSLLLAAPTMTQGVITLAVALVVAILIIFFTLKNKKTRKIWGKIILSQKLDTEQGYISNDEKLPTYLGKRGKALTVLRPAGTAEIDGQRVDVVTLGEFIDVGKPLEVTLVEGTRVVVREIHSEQIITEQKEEQ